MLVFTMNVWWQLTGREDTQQWKNFRINRVKVKQIILPSTKKLELH